MIAALALAGCNSFAKPKIQKEVRYIVSEPSKGLYNCPQPKLPTTVDLKNKDVNTLLAEFERANRTCVINMSKIKQSIEMAKKNVSGRK